MAQCPVLKIAKTTDRGSWHSKWPIPLAQDVYFLLRKRRRRGRRWRCTFFIDRLDILAIARLRLAAKLFLHRNKSTETKEVLLVSVRKGRATCSAPADNGSHGVFTPLYDNVRCHVLAWLRRESAGKGAPSVEERLSDKTLCSRFMMSDLFLFKLCECSWFKRTVVESSREVGVWKNVIFALRHSVASQRLPGWGVLPSSPKRWP